MTPIKTLKVLGITGGAGSGKSTLLGYLEKEYGAYLIECDEVARRLQQPGEICYNRMVGLFGSRILNADMTLNRRMVAEIIFRDRDARDKLNSIVHPAVKARVQELVSLHSDERLTVIEAALLLDCGYGDICDEIWYVRADDDVRRRRLMSSRGYSADRVNSMFESQRTDESFRKLTSCTIDNSSDDISAAYAQIDAELKKRGIEKNHWSST